MRRKGKIVASIIIFMFIFLTTTSHNSEATTAIANLILKTNGGGVRPDYALFIARDLRELGIEVTIRVVEWSVFVGTLKETHDYDMGIVGLTQGANLDLRDIYTEDGSLNIFGLERNLPYGEINEQMQDEGMLIVDPIERQKHYYDWQKLILDKIVPMLPLFTPQNYLGSWSNLQGYQAEWGLYDSLPYMEFDGYHENQKSLTELRLSDANWHELSPLHSCDCAPHPAEFLLNERLMTLSRGYEPMKTGLVRDWDIISDTHIKFYMRDNVYWNPSFNIETRNETSIPLDSIPTSELMRGLKNDQFSNGTNRKVTAKDAVFSILAYANPVVSEYTYMFEWVVDCYEDYQDPLAFHIQIDEDPGTSEIEILADFWRRMDLIVMPEFFLNSTNPTVTYTRGGVECVGLYADMDLTTQWRSYSASLFGCGKYMLDYTTWNGPTVLRASPYWMGVGAIDGTSQDLDIEKIICNVIPYHTTQLDLFIGGELDFFPTLTSFPHVRRILENDPRFTVYSDFSGHMLLLFFNLQRPFIGGANNYEYLQVPGKEAYTRGIALRKAICYAIDREEINRKVHNEEYLILNSVIYPSLSYYYYYECGSEIDYCYDLGCSYEWLNLSSGYYPDQGCNGCLCNTSETSTSMILTLIALVSLAAFLLKHNRKKKSEENRRF